MGRAVTQVEELFALYEQPMYRVAFAILHDAGQAEDAVMTAFEHVIRKGGALPLPGSDHAKRLLTTIVRNCANDIYRRNRRQIERMAPLEGDGLNGASDAELLNALSRMDLTSALEALPERYRTVLTARFLDELTVSEVAQRLGISEATVRKRQQRALEMVRASWERRGGVTDCE